MTAALASALASRLALLPFADPEQGARVTGLARLWTATVLDGDTPRVTKTPVPATFTAADCERDSRYLVPDLSTPSIFYFEDGGTSEYTIARNLQGHESSLRLLGWLNPHRLSAVLSENRLVQALTTALRVRDRHHEGEYRDLSITATVLPAETSLFSRYSFEDVTPLLLPPFQLVGLDLKCRFTAAPACPPAALPTIVPTTLCQPSTVSSFFTPAS